MTKLLEKAFAEASKLPEIEQNKVAKWLLDELASEKRWEKAFAESEDVLGQLADEALIRRELGELSPRLQAEVADKLRKLFGLI